MYTFLVIIHAFVSLILIMVVLLQSGKGASMGAAFGGGGQTMFGARGQTTFIQKMTVGAAILFMVLSVALASLSSRGQSDLDGDEPPPPGQEAGMMPAEEPAGDDGAAEEAGMTVPAVDEGAEAKDEAKDEPTKDEPPPAKTEKADETAEETAAP